MYTNKTIRNMGLTLIELILVLALIGLVIGGAFSLHIFSASTFNAGSDQYENQADIRLAIESLTKDARFAKKIKIIDYDKDNKPTLSPYQTLIYYDMDNKILVKESSVTEYVHYYNDGIGQPLIFNKVSFNTVNYLIEGNYGSKYFNINSDLFLLNAPEDEAKGEEEDTLVFEDDSLDSGDALIFTSPELYRVQLLAPEIRIPEPEDLINTPNLVTLLFNKSMIDYSVDYYVESIVVTSSKVTSSDIVITTESRDGGLSTLISVKINAQTKDIKNGDSILVTLTNSNSDKFDFELIYDNGTKQWSL